MIPLPRRLIRSFIVCAGLCIPVAACNKPPADAYVGGLQDAAALDLGTNTVNEACSLQRDIAEAQIYCGTYLEPAGRIVTPDKAADPVAFLTESSWRTSFDSRFQCGAPVATTVLNNPAASLACTRRQGGWQHVVLATRIDGTMYVADGAKPTEAVLPRAIGVFAGKLPAVPVASTGSGLTTERAGSSR